MTLGPVLNNLSRSYIPRDFQVRLAALLILLPIMAFLGACHRKAGPVAAAASPSVESPEQKWKEAAIKVEEPRQGPIGLHAAVDVPPELTHSGDRHRFLALQAAEYRKQGLDLPADFAGLASLIQKGELVEMPMTGDDYVLFGVGGIATDGPLTYYDPENRVSIPIYSSDQEYQLAEGNAAQAALGLREAIAGLKKDLALTAARDRVRRVALRKDISAKQEQLNSGIAEQERIALYYQDQRTRGAIAAEYKELAELAANFNGTAYDLSDPVSRLAFKVRLLSFVRPPARDALEEIGGPYFKAFGRPLPVTSLVRTEEYQRELSETNPNAARNNAPPHSTGLAFDVYYHFMDASEQVFLMKELAQLKDAGKIEALRETRDHFHVFAFADGQPPPENLVASSMIQLENKDRDKDVRGRRQAGLGIRSKHGRRKA